MEGFLDGVPVQAKVTWATSEVTLLNGKPLVNGLLAEVPTPGVPGGVTRYLVPWQAISYLKQDIPAPPPATTGQVTTTTPVPPPPTDR